jgi:hypothetical protein
MKHKNSSSSSVDSDLAYGTGYIRKRKSKERINSHTASGYGIPPPNYGGHVQAQGHSFPHPTSQPQPTYPAHTGPVQGPPPPTTYPSEPAYPPGAPTFPLHSGAAGEADSYYNAGPEGHYFAPPIHPDVQSRGGEKKKKKSRDAEAEILAVGAGLAKLAQDPRINREGSSKTKHHEATRGIPSSRPHRADDDDGWESASDDDSDQSSSSVDSALAFGGEDTWIPPARPRPVKRKSTIVDPRLFGPQNSLSGVVTRPVGFGDFKDQDGGWLPPRSPPTVKETGYVTPKTLLKQGYVPPPVQRFESTRASSSQSSRGPLQHVYPIPTDDPNFIDAARSSVSGERPIYNVSRTDSLPLRQPKPVTPISKEVYETKPTKPVGTKMPSFANIAIGAMAANSKHEERRQAYRELEQDEKQREIRRRQRRERERLEQEAMLREEDDQYSRREGKRPDKTRVDPFQYQVPDDAFEITEPQLIRSRHSSESPVLARSTSHGEWDNAVPQIVTAEPKEEFKHKWRWNLVRHAFLDEARRQKFVAMVAAAEEEGLSARDEHVGSSRGRKDSPEVNDPRERERSKAEDLERDKQHILEEVEHFTAPIEATAIAEAVAEIEAEDLIRERSRSRSGKFRKGRRSYHSSPSRDQDEIQVEADRVYRETVLARRIASERDKTGNGTPKVVTPPAMELSETNWEGPNADFELDHVMLPHEEPHFSPVVVRKFDFPPDHEFHPSKPFDPSVVGLNRPLLNLVRPTPSPENQIIRLKEPRSRSASRDRVKEVSTEVDDDVPIEIVTAEPKEEFKHRWRWGLVRQAFLDQAHRTKLAALVQAAEDEARKRAAEEEARSLFTGGTAEATVLDKDPPAEVTFEYRGVVVEPEESPKAIVDTPPPAVGPKPAFPETPEPHLPGSFEEDPIFVASTAAGLEDAGFDPEIIIKDESFNRRATPPGSDVGTVIYDPLKSEIAVERSLPEEESTLVEPKNVVAPAAGVVVAAAVTKRKLPWGEVRKAFVSEARRIKAEEEAAKQVPEVVASADQPFLEKSALEATETVQAPSAGVAEEPAAAEEDEWAVPAKKSKKKSKGKKGKSASGTDDADVEPPAPAPQDEIATRGAMTWADEMADPEGVPEAVRDAAPESPAELPRGITQEQLELARQMKLEFEAAAAKKNKKKNKKKGAAVEDPWPEEPATPSDYAGDSGAATPDVNADEATWESTGKKSKKNKRKPGLATSYFDPNQSFAESDKSLPAADQERASDSVTPAFETPFETPSELPAGITPEQLELARQMREEFSSASSKKGTKSKKKKGKSSSPVIEPVAIVEPVEDPIILLEEGAEKTVLVEDITASDPADVNGTATPASEQSSADDAFKPKKLSKKDQRKLEKELARKVLEAKTADEENTEREQETSASTPIATGPENDEWSVPVSTGKKGKKAKKGNKIALNDEWSTAVDEAKSLSQAVVDTAPIEATTETPVEDEWSTSAKTSKKGKKNKKAAWDDKEDSEEPTAPSIGQPIETTPAETVNDTPVEDEWATSSKKTKKGKRNKKASWEDEVPSEEPSAPSAEQPIEATPVETVTETPAEDEWAVSGKKSKKGKKNKKAAWEDDIASEEPSTPSNGQPVETATEAAVEDEWSMPGTKKKKKKSKKAAWDDDEPSEDLPTPVEKSVETGIDAVIEDEWSVPSKKKTSKKDKKTGQDSGDVFHDAPNGPALASENGVSHDADATNGHETADEFYDADDPGDIHTNGTKDIPTSEEQSFLGKAGTLGAGVGLIGAVAAAAASVLGSQKVAGADEQETTEQGESSPPVAEAQDKHEALQEVEDQGYGEDDVEPEVVERVVSPNLDPQYGDCLPLPPSALASQVGDVDKELPGLPESPVSEKAEQSFTDPGDSVDLEVVERVAGLSFDPEYGDSLPLPPSAPASQVGDVVKELPGLPESPGSEKAEQSFTYPDHSVDPEVVERVVRTSFDPEYGDYLPLPPSAPASQFVDVVKELPDLPESPGSEKAEPSFIYTDDYVDPEIVERVVRPSFDPQYGDYLPLPPSAPASQLGELDQDLPDLPESPISEKAEHSFALPDDFVDPEVVERPIKPSIDPQYGDLLPLPPSQPGSPGKIILQELPTLPESPPPNETAKFDDFDTPTPRRNSQRAIVRSPSVNAIPLRFLMTNRSTPSSPATAHGEHLVASPLGANVDEADPGSPRRAKSRPTSWTGFKGIVPLHLPEITRQVPAESADDEWFAPSKKSKKKKTGSRSVSDISAFEVASEAGPLEVAVATEVEPCLDTKGSELVGPAAPESPEKAVLLETVQDLHVAEESLSRDITESELVMRDAPEEVTVPENVGDEPAPDTQQRELVVQDDLPVVEESLPPTVPENDEWLAPPKKSKKKKKKGSKGVTDTFALDVAIEAEPVGAAPIEAEPVDAKPVEPKPIEATVTIADEPSLDIKEPELAVPDDEWLVPLKKSKKKKKGSKGVSDTFALAVASEAEPAEATVTVADEPSIDIKESEVVVPDAPEEAVLVEKDHDLPLVEESLPPTIPVDDAWSIPLKKSKKKKKKGGRALSDTPPPEVTSDAEPVEAAVTIADEPSLDFKEPQLVLPAVPEQAAPLEDARDLPVTEESLAPTVPADDEWFAPSKKSKKNKKKGGKGLIGTPTSDLASGAGPVEATILITDDSTPDIMESEPVVVDVAEIAAQPEHVQNPPVVEESLPSTAPVDDEWFGNSKKSKKKKKKKGGRGLTDTSTFEDVNEAGPVDATETIVVEHIPDKAPDGQSTALEVTAVEHPEENLPAAKELPSTETDVAREAISVDHLEETPQATSAVPESVEGPPSTETERTSQELSVAPEVTAVEHLEGTLQVAPELHESAQDLSSTMADEADVASEGLFATPEVTAVEQPDNQQATTEPEPTPDGVSDEPPAVVDVTPVEHPEEALQTTTELHESVEDLPSAEEDHVAVESLQQSVEGHSEMPSPTEIMHDSGLDEPYTAYRLQPVPEEDSPEAEKDRSVDDFNRDSAFVSGSPIPPPRPFVKEHDNRDSGVQLNSPVASSDDALARLSWPAVDDAAETVNLERSVPPNSSGFDITESSSRLSPAVVGLGVTGLTLATDQDHNDYSARRVSPGFVRKTPEPTLSPTPRRRSITPRSDRKSPIPELEHLRTPLQGYNRPGSATSNRSTGTPPLRRVSRQISGELRSLGQRVQPSLSPNLTKQQAKEAERSPAGSNLSQNNINPVANEGRVRLKDMADVYVCLFPNESLI